MCRRLSTPTEPTPLQGCLMSLRLAAPLPGEAAPSVSCTGSWGKQKHPLSVDQGQDERAPTPPHASCTALKSSTRTASRGPLERLRWSIRGGRRVTRGPPFRVSNGLHFRLAHF